MGHNEHHFVPGFLLREWQTGDDRKLTSFRWDRGAVVASRFKAKSVAKQRHLYATGLSEGRPDNKVELEFMTPKVDDPAAVAHQVILAQGINSLDERHKRDWARFLVSQWLRTPGMVEQVKLRGREILMRGDELVATDVLKEGEQQVLLHEWLEEHEPSLFDDLGINTLPYIVQSSVLNDVFLGAKWAVREIKRSRFDFLVGDNPLVYEGQMNESFLFALPVSPQKLFIAYSDDHMGENVNNEKDDGIAMTINRSQADQAERYVFSTNGRQCAVVTRYLRKPLA